jgi:hypothetical protein
MKKDRSEVQKLTAYYQPWLGWTDKGILHDLKVRHDLVDPSNSLLIAIALRVATEHQITFGRQEQRRKQLMIGWLNKYYNLINVDTLDLYEIPGVRGGMRKPYATATRTTDASAAQGGHT